MRQWSSTGSSKVEEVDLALDGAAQIGDLLRALAGEHDHQIDVGGVGEDAVGDVLEQEGLAGLRWRHDEGPLALAEGRHEVDEPLRQVLLPRLQHQLLRRIHGGEIVEVGAGAGQLRVGAVDGLDADQAKVALALLGGAHLPGNLVAGAQAEASDLRLGDVDVAGAGAEALLAQEAVAVADDLEQASGQHVPLALGEGLQQVEDDLLPPQGAILDAHLMGQIDQLFLGLGLKL